MFRFEDPQYLYLLAVVVLLALIRLITYRKQKQRLQRFGDPDLVSQLMPLVSRWRSGCSKAPSPCSSSCLPDHSSGKASVSRRRLVSKPSSLST